jgi:hypothetical protein
MMFTGGLVLRTTADDAAAGTGTTFAIDADTGSAGIQPTRAVAPAVGANFTIDVHLTNVVPTYGAYQVAVDYDDVLFTAVGLPNNWNDTPVLDVTSGSPGGTVVYPSGAICDPVPTTNSIIGEDGGGTASLSMSCAASTFGELTSYTGVLVSLVFRCETNGTGNITLQDVNGTFVLDGNINQFNDNAPGAGSAQVACGSGGAAPTSTNTPLPGATNTPAPTQTPISVPATNTPTRTASPTRTAAPDAIEITPTPRSGTTTGGGTAPPPAPTAPGGRPGGVITGPDTGDGGWTGSEGPFVSMLFVAGIVLLLSGLAPLSAGVVTRWRSGKGG